MLGALQCTAVSMPTGCLFLIAKVRTRYNWKYVRLLAYLLPTGIWGLVKLLEQHQPAGSLAFRKPSCSAAGSGSSVMCGFSCICIYSLACRFVASVVCLFGRLHSFFCTCWARSCCQQQRCVVVILSCIVPLVFPWPWVATAGPEAHHLPALREFGLTKPVRPRMPCAIRWSFCTAIIHKRGTALFLAWPPHHHHDRPAPPARQISGTRRQRPWESQCGFARASVCTYTIGCDSRARVTQRRWALKDTRSDRLRGAIRDTRSSGATVGMEGCWICLQDDGELIQPCKCPRLVHRKCLASWQLYSTGTRSAVATTGAKDSVA